MSTAIGLLLVLGMAAGIVWIIYRLLVPAKGRAMVCTVCGHHGATVQRTRGSFVLEVVLWLAFLLPGLIYSIWRLSTRTDACAECGGTALVPATSPAGRKMLAEQRDAA